MSGRSRSHEFAARPGGADAWVRAPDARTPRADAYSARLTIDITPALRARIKIAAFQREQTVADMLRAMLEETFPETGA